MLPMSSSNHHTHIESNWKTYYDAKKILRQAEQRLKDARDYYPHVHLNNHYDNNDLSPLSSSSYVVHGDTSSVYAGNRSILNDDRTINNKHQLLDSEALQTIRRKINKQKIAAERRAEQLFHSQSDAGHMFESYRPHGSYSTSASLQNLHYSPYRQPRISPPKPQPSYSSHLSQSQSFPSELDTVLRNSNNSKALHKDPETIRTNDIDRQPYHQPVARKSTKVLPNDNYSLTNGRTSQQRSSSASSSLANKYQDLPPSHFLTTTDSQRIKHVRRVESAHGSSSSGIITPDSWPTDPIITKKLSALAQQDKSSKKKPVSDVLTKRMKTDIEESLPITNQLTEKIFRPKRDISASKPSAIIAEKTPLKPSLPKSKSDDENKKLEDLIQQKRQQQDEILSNEKRSKDEQSRKDKHKKSNEQIKENSHPYLQSSINKRSSAFAPVTPKDLTEQTRQRLLSLLGPSTDYPPTNSYESRSLHERRSSSSSSSSSLSSSNDSVVDQTANRLNDPLIVRSRSEPPIENGTLNGHVQRHENLLRWAVNLTRDCDMVENRFKYLRSNGTQPFDPLSYQHLQNDDGNLRYQTSHYDINNGDMLKPSSVTRLSERLNSNHINDYSTPTLTNGNEHRDLVLERRIYCDRAAAKIQAAYRGYTVRKSLPWLNEKQKYLNDEFNQRPNHHRETSTGINVETRLANDSFPIDSTLLRYHENSAVNDYPQQSTRKLTTLPLYTDDYDIPTASLSNLSTPINHKQIPNSHFPSDVPITNLSTLTTSIPSPEPNVPLTKERRRSISPPLPPQMSPDNGRPLPHLTQTNSQRLFGDQNESAKQSKTSTRSQNSPMNPLTQQQIRKSPTQQASSSSSTSSISSTSTVTNRKRRSPSPQQQPPQQTMTNLHSRHRASQNSSPPSSSSESILTAREKRIRQKFNSDIELQAYEKRLKDIEKKIRQLVKRAFEIFDEKRSISSPPTAVRASKSDSSSHNRSKSTNHVQDESSISEENSIHRKETDLIRKDNDTSSASTQHRQSDVVTSDASDLERRVRAYREQLKAKKFELERLKQRKNKEILRRQEDELKKQIESCDHEIQTLRSQPIQQEQTVPVPSVQDVNDVINSNLPGFDKDIHLPKQEVFDNAEEKEVQEKPLETPRDERDTQHDAQSISVATDLPVEYETDHDSRRPSIDNEKRIIDSNEIHSILHKEKEDSLSSSSSSEKNIKSLSPQVSKSPSPLSAPESIKSQTPPAQEPVNSLSSLLQERVQNLTKEQGFIPIDENKRSRNSSLNNEYDEDFSDNTHSPRLSPIKPTNNNDIHAESIQEDIEKTPSVHESNRSSSSKSSAEEQSEILVFGKVPSSKKPKSQNEKPMETKLPINQRKIETDDTSRDISEDDEGNKRVPNESNVNKLTEILVQAFIDEAIDHGKEIENVKNSLKKDLSDLMSSEEIPSDDTQKQTMTSREEEEADKEIPVFSKESDGLDKSDTTNGTNEEEDLKIDLTPLDDYTPDEPTDVNNRKPNDEDSATSADEKLIKLIIERPIKPVVTHTHEQVIRLCHEALDILYNQNEDFSVRSSINRTIPESYFNYQQQDSDNEDIRRSLHAYHQMIFDLCVELLYQMYSSNLRTTKYPEWQKTKLIPKRFYRLHKPNNRNEAEIFIQQKVLEILNLTPRQITYSKWRVTLGRRNDIEQFENVLDEELRRTEPQWIDYEDDCLRIKFDVAEHIFDQLVQETLTECVHIVNKRIALSSK